MQTNRVEISYRTIASITLFIILLWFLYAIRSVLVALFIATILMFALNPLVSYLEKKHIPRGLASILLLIFVLLIFSGMVASIIPAVIEQSKNLIIQIPLAIKQIGLPSIEQRVLSDQLGSIPGNIARIVISAFSNIVALFTLLVVTYYLLSERKYLHRYLVAFFKDANLEKRVEEFIDKLEHQIGGWVRGQVTLMLIIGVLTYIGLLLIGVSYALPLAIIAGILEIIPNIGPTLAMIPAVLVTLSIPVTTLATIALYFLIQQFENSIVVPKVMQRAIGIRPLVTITLLMVGFKLAGGMGAILAIPAYLTLKVIFEEFFIDK